MSNQFSIEDLNIIITSLQYSIQHVSDYPHPDYKTKRESLKPIELTLNKSRFIRKEMKGSSGE